MLMPTVANFASLRCMAHNSTVAKALQVFVCNDATFNPDFSAFTATKPHIAPIFFCVFAHRCG